MSQQGIYSELKPAWWYSREGLPKTPKQVQVILSDLCNQDCAFCAYRMSGYTSNQLFVGDSPTSAKGHNNPVRMMDTPRVMTLLDEMKRAGVLALQFTGGGEPTVQPDHEKIFTKALDMGFKCSLVSNGIKWSNKLRREILPRFSWVRVSIDAATRDNYALIRRVPESHWDTVWGNVIDFALHKGDCTFGLGFVVTPYNWEDIEMFASIAAESGADNMRYTAMFNPEDDKPYENCFENIAASINRARKRDGKAITIHDNFGTRISDLKQHAPDYDTCSYQHFTTYIGGDFNLYRCCVLSYNERGKIEGGNLKEQAFDTYWDSDARKHDMDKFNARDCERCQFNEKNRAVSYLAQLKPSHIEFP